MKTITKKILKALLVFVITSFAIYSLLTISNFIKWANENELKPYSKEEDILKMDSQKIKTIGNNIKQFENVMNESLTQPREEGEHVLAEYYDPLGFSVWSYMNLGIQKIFTTSSIILSVLTGIGITIAYTAITSKKLNILLKIIIGYFAVILVVPHIYIYSYTYRLWDFVTVYKSMPAYFYIGFTLIFVIMFAINYIVGIKMTKELNQMIKTK
ncbi:MAG: hypothetical protein J6M60_06560 [Clostridia bacterium]|nr:hypothetical protein [Clostridia bacterium]